ncbi:MAG: YceI family protein [Gemmatimonadetes bacterium]|nr:YceI family protein [Gemmatimonadota bacterium]
MKQFTTLIVVLGAALGTASFVFADDEVYMIDGEASEVRFDSKAPMESFHGETNAVTGFVRFDDDNFANLHLKVEVDLTQLTTGIKLRDRHMRENHLHTDKYPKAVFESRALAKEASGPLRPNETTSLVLAGTFTLHGVTREMAIPVEVRKVTAGPGAGDNDASPHIDVVSVFPIELDAFEIPRPKFLVLKLDETQKITLRLRLVKDAD